jgi:hypothetical protein
MVSFLRSMNVVCIYYLKMAAQHYLCLILLLFEFLWAGWSRDRIPVGARFFAHIQTGPGAHPASCAVATGSYPGVKWPGRGAHHPPPSSAKVTNE